MSYGTSAQSHDAGYDAYMTGIVFASLSKFIEIGKIIGKHQEPEADTQADKKTSTKKA